MLGPATLCVKLHHASFFLNVVTLKNVFEFVIRESVSELMIFHHNCFIPSSCFEF